MISGTAASNSDNTTDAALEVLRVHVGFTGGAVDERLDEDVHVRIVDAAVPIEEEVAGLGPGRRGEVVHE